MKTSKWYLFVISCILVSVSSGAWATALHFGNPPQTGAIGSPAQSNTYTFNTTLTEVLDFTMVTTSGNLVPKMQLYNSAGTLIASNYSGAPFGCGGSTLEMNEVQLSADSYILDVSDCSGTNTGDYALYAQSTNHPVGAEPLPFAEVQTGAIGSPAQSNTYTFSANASDVVDFTIATTSGSLVPKIMLFNPDGTLNSSNYSGAPFGCGGTTLEMNTVTLPVAGDYTVFIGDCADTNSGDYEIYMQRTDHAPGTSLLFGQIQTGSITSETQSNTYTFGANASDVLDFTMVTTSGSLVPMILLYNPNGSLNSSNYSGAPFGCGGSTLEMNTVALPVTGTYTVLVRDCSDTNTGNYAIYSQRTNNPAGAVILPFAQRRTGLIGSVARSNTYVFSGSKSEVVDFTLVATNGGLVPEILLYNPNGSLNSSNYSGAPFGCGGSTLEMNTVTLPVTGTYTVLVRDCSDVNTGNYAIYAQSTNNPFAPAPVLWGQLQTGTVGSVAQSNTYTFSGTANNVVDFTMMTTKGSLVPEILLYNPDGSLNSSNYSGAPFGCGGSTVALNSVTLTQDGDYTMLVRDCSDTNIGNYEISSQCSGICPDLNPISLSFSSQLLGTTSAAKMVTLTNAGTTTLTINGISLTGTNAGDFSQTHTCGSTLGAGASCTISVTFHPLAIGTRSAAVSVSDDAGGSPQKVALSGSGTVVKLVPGSLSFGDQTIGTTSAAKTATLTNAGTTTLTISGISLTGSNAGDFGQTHTCGATLGAGASCTISVTFHPSAIGARSAAVSISDNGGGSPQLVPLSGSGTVVKLVPGSLSFGDQTIGTTSAAKTATLTNAGTTTLTISGISLTGSNAGDFGQTHTCGATLGAGASCTISVTFHPSAIGARSAAVSISDNGGGSPQLVPLSGSGTVVKLVPGSLSFGDQTIGTTSAAKTATLTNAGTTTLTISGISLTGSNAGDFGQTHTCGATLGAGASCTISVTFHPSAIGARSAAVSISDNGGGSPQLVPLSGSGTVVKLVPGSLSFGDQTIGTTSAAKTATLTNAGTTTLTISGISLTGSNAGDFSQTHTCGATLGAGASCTISVTFHPSAIGARSAAVSISDNGGGSPQLVPLSGSGTVVKLVPGSLSFGDQTIGTTSAAKTATLTNAGTTTLTISGISLTGSNAGDFSQTHTCGATLGAGASCTISVTFHPSAIGARSAAVSISDNGGGSPQLVPLSGSGTVVKLVPGSLSFGDQTIGTTSAAKTATLTNAGTTTLTISGISLTGSNAGDFSQTHTCGATLGAGASCTISVTFHPSAIGARSAAVSISDNGGGSPQLVPLSGTGT